MTDWTFDKANSLALKFLAMGMVSFRENNDRLIRQFQDSLSHGTSAIDPLDEMLEA